MPSKEFSPSLKLNYGDHAEQVVLEFLLNRLGQGRVEHLPLGPYGPDLSFQDNNGLWIYADVERRGNWRADQDTFPFETVHMPKRKLKFARLGQPYFYISVRDDCRRAIIFSDNSIQSAVCIVCGNRFVPEGEEFIDLPLAEGRYVSLSDG